MQPPLQRRAGCGTYLLCYNIIKSISMLKSDTEILSIKGLSLTVKKGTVILDGIHFSLRAGEKLAVIGPNGSGKSSLLRAIIGEVNPDKGTLYWQGCQLRHLSPQARAEYCLPVAKRYPRFAPDGGRVCSIGPFTVSRITVLGAGTAHRG